MSAFDVQTLRKLFGKGADPHAGSLTGDLSQRLTAAIARELQSTSPGLTRNKAGSLGEQLQYLIDTWDNTVAPGDVANGSGSGAAMLKYLVANVPTPAALRPLSLVNGYDVWGFNGWSVNGDGTASIAPNDIGLNSQGYVRGGTIGGITFLQVNQVVGRNQVVQFKPTGNPQYCALAGGNSGGNARQLGWPVGLPGGYTKLEMEAVVSTASIAAAHLDVFMGWSDVPTSDVFAATRNAVGIGYRAGDTNWSIIVVKNGVVTKTTVASINVLTAYDIKVTFDGTTVTGLVGATSATTSGATLPTQATMAGLASPTIIAISRGVITDAFQIEWLRERLI